MQQDGALAHASGAAGVLQQRNVVGLDVGFLERTACALRHCVIEPHGAGQVEGGHHLFDVAHHVVDQRAFEHAQLVSHGAQHHMLDGRVDQALLQRGGKVLDDHDGLGTRILELVLQLARCVQRVHIHHHKAGSQDGRHRDGVLRHVGHHDGHAVALDQAQALQVGREGVAQRIGLGIRDVLAHEAVGNTVGVLGECLVHEGDEGWVFGQVNISRNALRIGGQPGAVGHFHCLLIRFIVITKAR